MTATMVILSTLAGLKTILTVVYVIVDIMAISYIIYERRDPVKSLAWIMVVAVVPIVGVILYVVFGRSHRKEKIFNLKEITDLEQFERLSAGQVEALSNPDVMLRRSVAENRDVITLLLNNNKSPLTMRNRVTILNNGKATFASIMEALKSARSSIHMEYYIYENDRIGGKIAKILMDKARAGVEVRFIYDDVGSWSLKRSFRDKLKEAGVHVRGFMPVAFPWFTSKINYRNHRKIVVVDGKVAFTGGINIADRYLRRSRKLGVWRDTHLRVEGEAVNMLQAVFATDWYFVSGKEKLNDSKKYFPEAAVAEECPMQIATSGPDSDWANIMQAFFAAITRAENHIYISTPYFLPDQAVLTALKVAALSGIDVRVMIPSRSDSKIVYWATRSYVTELLEAGIKVYLYKRGFNHSKIIMIDGRFSSVGTANMDVRSFEHNFEVSAIMYDRRVAQELEEHFLHDLEHSVQVTPEKWERRPRLHGVYEALARLLSPLL